MPPPAHEIFITSNPSEAPTSYAVFAPTENGFFGLSQLKHFTESIIAPYAQHERKLVLVLDFSLVKVWDIAALLWLTVALHHYRHDLGLPFLLRLPEGRATMPRNEAEALDKSADYLRRWEFDMALQNITPEVEGLLVPDQRGFFASKGPKKYYAESKISDESGVLQSLISRRLVQIRNLTDPMFSGTNRVSATRVAQCVRAFQSQRIGDILAVQCGIEKRQADFFSDHLLTEALMNVLEHPNATIGLVAISVMGKSKELILSVADNGDSIAQTIYRRYIDDHKESALETQYKNKALSPTQRAKIIDHATKEGVTSKTGHEAISSGMGLAYIKEDTVEKFKGKLRIISSGVMLKYQPDCKGEPDVQEWTQSWKGNLLRITIPLGA